MAGEVLVPLKAKYIEKKLGEKNGQYKTRTGNSHPDRKRFGQRPNPRRYPSDVQFYKSE